MGIGREAVSDRLGPYGEPYIFIFWIMKSHGNAIGMAVIILKAHQNNKTMLY